LVRGALQGDGGAVVIAGPPGVGKSRLARECARVAEANAFASAHAIATRAAATIPLGAFAALLPRESLDAGPGVDMVGRAAELITREVGDRLLLVVDDAHLLDDASAAVLQRIATARMAFVVVTVRSGEGTPDPVAALGEETVPRIELANLGPTDTASLVTTSLGGPVDGATQRDLFEASQGNPLFVRELVRGAVDAALLVEEGGLWRLAHPLATSPRLTELIEARLSDLEPEQREVIELVAFSEPVRLSLLATLAPRSAIEAVEARGLVVLDSDPAAPLVRIAHPLYGDVVRSRMSPLHTMRVNRVLADAAERVGAASTDESIRAAVWRADGGGAARPELMLAAARRAHFGGDAHLAERLARAALESGGGIQAAVLLAEVLGTLARHAEAEQLLAARAAALANDDERALVALRRAQTLFWSLGRDEAAATVLREAEAAVEDATWQAVLSARRAGYEIQAGKLDEGLALVRLPLERAQGRVFVEAAIAAEPALAATGRCDEALALADRALAEHTALGDEIALLNPGIHFVARALALIEAGRLAEAEETAGAAYEGALALHLPMGQAWMALALGRVAIARGRCATAARFLQEAAAVSRDIGQDALRRWSLSERLVALAHLEQAADCDRVAAGLEAVGDAPLRLLDLDLGRARAWHAVSRGDVEGARSMLGDAADRARRVGALAREASALHDLARLGDPDAAAPRLAEIAATFEGALTPLRARHAAALVRDAAEELVEVADAFEAMGADLLAAEAISAAGAAYGRAQHDRDAQGCVARADELARRCEGARTPGLAAGGVTVALTPREREIVKLAARGLPSKEIAGQLGLSRRTVDNHLQRAYEKLGVSSRAELAETVGLD